MCAAGRARLPEVRWRTMAAEAIEGGAWDWIFSSSMLQWATDPSAVFAGWREGLAESGRVLGGLFSAGSLAEWSALAPGAAPLTWRTAPAWRSLLEKSGLRVVRDGVERRVFTHPSAAAFLRSLHGVGAAPERQLPAGQLRRLLHAYERGHRTPEGVTASWEFYRFEAEK